MYKLNIYIYIYMPDFIFMICFILCRNKLLKVYNNPGDIVT
jgi:hypothetical protein